MQTYADPQGTARLEQMEQLLEDIRSAVATYTEPQMSESSYESFDAAERMAEQNAIELQPHTYEPIDTGIYQHAKDIAAAEVLGHELPVAAHEAGHLAGVSALYRNGHDAKFHPARTNIGDGPVVESLEHFGPLYDVDDISVRDLASNSDNLRLGHIVWSGDAAQTLYGDAIVNGAAIAAGSLAPVASTLWANDNEKKLGRRIGATLSTAMPLYHSATGYHLDEIAQLTGTTPDIIGLPATFLSGGLLAYNAKKLGDKAHELKKRNRMRAFVEKFDEDLSYRHAAQDYWEDYAEDIDEDVEALLGNLDTFTVADVHDRVAEITRDYETFCEDATLLDNVKPQYVWERRKKRKDAECVEQTWLDFTNTFEKEIGEDMELQDPVFEVLDVRPAQPTHERPVPYVT